MLSPEKAYTSLWLSNIHRRTFLSNITVVTANVTEIGDRQSIESGSWSFITITEFDPDYLTKKCLNIVWHPQTNTRAAIRMVCNKNQPMTWPMVSIHRVYFFLKMIYLFIYCFIHLCIYLLICLFICTCIFTLFKYTYIMSCQEWPNRDGDCQEQPRNTSW